MSQTTQQAKAVPVFAAACLLLASAATGHAILGIACALTVFIGLYVRALPGRRILGTAIFLAGTLSFSAGLLLTAGGIA